jgi:oligopeptide transport system ATP-binding protein
VGFGKPAAPIPVVKDLSFSIASGETLAIVGESGSGKSVTSLAVMGLLPEGTGHILGGSITWLGTEAPLDLARADLEAIRRLRGSEIAMIFQEPMTSLNPVYTVGAQIAETVRLHQGVGRKAALDRSAEMLDLVGIPEPRRRLDNYPHEMSGGMRQRVMIALALACNPRLLIADEPTTALDVTIQAQILELIARLQRDLGMAVLFITHDLGVVTEIADRVAVMYGGRIVETGKADEIIDAPLHPYTRGLLAARPTPSLKSERAHRLTVLPGQVPDPRELPLGCLFHPRCSAFRPGLCDTAEPPLLNAGSDRLARCIRWREIAEEGLPARESAA